MERAGGLVDQEGPMGFGRRGCSSLMGCGGGHWSDRAGEWETLVSRRWSSCSMTLLELLA